MKLQITALLAAGLFLSACATRPDAIVPVSMGNAFAETPCDEAQMMLNAERQTLVNLEQAQRDAAAGDAIGVFLILVPVSSLTGNDREGQIATSKGKVIALENRLMSC